MNRSGVALAVLLSCALSTGCVENKRAVVPPVPAAPAPVVKAPPEPAPVIEAQNAAFAATPQPIPPGAVPAHELPALQPLTTERESPAPARATSGRTTANPPARTTAQENPVPATGQPEPVIEERSLPSRLEPSRPRTVRSEAEITGTLSEVNALINRLTSRQLDPESLAALGRIRSLVRLTQDALKRGNLPQADDLIKRAASMARDLARHP